MAQKRIPSYANGECPTSRLIVLETGFNNTDRDWVIRLPAATLRRWNDLRQRAYARTGRWLQINDGWSTDRPYWVQVMYRQAIGKFAADPGKSSHGMVFEGQQTAAIDVGNWSWVYADHGYDAWQEDVRAAGFTRLPDGYQQVGEYHHIIDWNPWDDEPEFGGAGSAGGSNGYTITPTEENDVGTLTGDQAHFLEAATADAKTAADAATRIETAVGLVKQSIFETVQWQGSDSRSFEQLRILRGLQVSAAAEAARDAALTEMVKGLAAVKGGITDAQVEQLASRVQAASAAGAERALRAVDFPTESSLVAAFEASTAERDLVAARAEVARLEAERAAAAAA